METFDNAVDTNTRAIGVMDSGVGGLTVLKQLLSVCPDENYIYFGDTKNLPYGGKSKAQLVEIVKEIFEFFETQKVKAVVLACNTTSATAYEELKDKYPFKIYPLIQSVARYMSADKGLLKLGVMATEATVKTKTYTKEFKKYNPDIEVIEQSCPLWVPIVENQIINYDENEAIYGYLKNVLAFNPQKIILGCTHYPLFKSEISAYLDGQTTIVDSATACADHVRDYLDTHHLRATVNKEGRNGFFVTDLHSTLPLMAARFLGRPLERIEKIALSDD